MTDFASTNDGYDVVVIGSGPAGLSAALAASECGASVLLCERLRQFGTKLLASGGSKCNISNTLEADAFLEAFGREGRFMKPALDIAYHDWLFPFLTSRNVPLKCDDAFHYFPRSERARDILSAFSGAIREHGGTMKTEAEIQHISVNDGAVSGVIFRDGTMTGCRSVVLAGGGTAWSALGGGRYGLDLAVELGHTLSPPLPAMAPLLIREPWVHALTGISLPDAAGRRLSEISCRHSSAPHSRRGKREILLAKRARRLAENRRPETGPYAPEPSPSPRPRGASLRRRRLRRTETLRAPLLRGGTPPLPPDRNPPDRIRSRPHRQGHGNERRHQTPGDPSGHPRKPTGPRTLFRRGNHGPDRSLRRLQHPVGALQRTACGSLRRTARNRHVYSSGAGTNPLTRRASSVMRTTSMPSSNRIGYASPRTIDA